MTDREDIEMLAAEYVLGTLDEGERADVAARRPHEPSLDAAISDWEARLAPMLEHVGEAKPRDMLADIQAQIAGRDASSGAGPAKSGEIVQLRRRVSRWRSAAIAASAIAAGLAGFIVLGEPRPAPRDQSFVAVFQEGDQPPQFVLSINLKTRELTIRPVAAEQHPGKTYQLWIVSDKLGPAPRSLGLLDAHAKPTRKQLREFDPTLLEAATFGISLEPEGGSPTGKPTGPALHGRLIPAAL